MIRSAAVYVGLPISSGGAHGLGRIGVWEAWRAWMGFLRQRTSFRDVAMQFHSLDLSSFREDAALFARMEHVRQVVRRSFPASAADPRSSPVPTGRIDEAIDLFRSFDPMPADRWGNTDIWLIANADFRLLDPRSGCLWPDQSTDGFGGHESYPGVPLGISSTRLHLDVRRSMGLELCVPEATDEDLRDLIPWLQDALPFRMSSKQWRRFTVTKSGTSYVGRRIPEDVIRGAQPRRD